MAYTLGPQREMLSSAYASGYSSTHLSLGNAPRGALSTILPALGYEIAGLDIKFLPTSGPQFQFVQEDIRRTTFPDEHFDAIVAVSTIERVARLSGSYG